VLSHQAAIKQIEEKKFVPVYLFYGEERYLQEELVEQLTAAFLGTETDFGKEKLDGAEYTLEAVLDRIGESGLFSERKLLIVDNPPYLLPPRKRDEQDLSGEPEQKDKKEDLHADILLSHLEAQASSIPEGILVFLSSQVDRRRRLFKLIDKRGVAVECGPLKGDSLAAWIRKKAAEMGKSIDRAALEKLLLAGDQNLHYISRELEKYCTFLKDDEEVITARTVDALFSGDIQGDVFKLSDALAEGSLFRADALLDLLLRRREKPLLIFFMLARHYRLLLQAHSLLEEGIPPAEFTGALEVHPFVARKLREQASLYNRALLEEVLIVLQEADFKIKTGRLEPADALKLMLARIDHVQKTAVG